MPPKPDDRDSFPVIALRGIAAYPDFPLSLAVGRPASLRALYHALEHREQLVLVAQRSAGVESPEPADLFDVGVVCGVESGPVRSGVAGVNIVVQGCWRCRIVRYATTEPFLRAVVQHLPDVDEPEPADLRRRIRERLARLAQQKQEAGERIVFRDSPAKVPPEYVAALEAALSIDERQGILTECSPSRRCERALELLARETSIFQAAARLRREQPDRMTEGQRREYLQERRKEVEGVLTDMAGEDRDLEDLRRRVGGADLPEEVRRQAEEELRRLSGMPRVSPEFPLGVDYVEWLVSLPWNRLEGHPLNLQDAQRVLDEDHYDREDIKERVLEYLAVEVLKPARQGTLLCFVGPPGVGKTSFGRSIAKATGRVFQRISLGGVRDEADIRGHRRTYVGALPGRIIRAMRNAGVNNPILLLDEVDKLSVGLQGDPAAALLEVLDPEQNNTFTDNYLGVPFDLSKVMFICTANTADTVPPALLDRLEVMRLSGYSIEEKVQIARRHLLPKQLERCGLGPEQVDVPDEVLGLLAERYTRESGVRGLERRLEAICRKVARDVVSGRGLRFAIGMKDAEQLLGPPPFSTLRTERTLRPGACPTMVLRPSGAEVLLAELQKVRGRGRLSVTGRTDEVLRESAALAYDYLRAAARRFDMKAEEIARWDYHLHFSGAGAPAETASLGLPIFVALLSALREQPVPGGVAVVGELTLTGKVLEVPDLPEKMVAAARAGISAVIAPERNRRDLDSPQRRSLPEGVLPVYCSSAQEAAEAVWASREAGTAAR